jgi:hypothetical protein
LLLSLPILTPSCLQVGFGASRNEEPVAEATLASLHAGDDDLATCLKKLGAPNMVWEYRGNGMALGWVSEDSTDWDLDVSFSFQRFASAKFSLDWDDLDLPGVVLWFDASLHLERWQKGLMREMVQSYRRTADVDLDVGS